MTNATKLHAFRVYRRTADIIDHLTHDDPRDENAIIADFYASQTYALLADEITKTWWYSTPALLDAYRTERATGSVANSPYLSNVAG